MFEKGVKGECLVKKGGWLFGGSDYLMMVIPGSGECKIGCDGCLAIVV